MFDFLKKKGSRRDESFDDFPESPYPTDNAAMPPMGADSGLPPIGNDMGMPPMDNPAPAFPDMNRSQSNNFAPDPYPPRPISPPAPAPVEQAVNPSGDKMEVVLAKLDTLKSMMEMLNQRIATLEHQIKEEKKRW